jgi:hypothetical protein
MSLFSDIFSFLKDLFQGLLDFLKDNLWLIVLVLVAIYLWYPEIWATILEFLAPIGQAAASVWGWLSGIGLTDLLVGAAALWFIIDPAGFTEAVTSFVREAVTAVASGISEGLGLPGILLAGAGLWLFFKSRDKDKDPELNKGGAT